MMEKLVTTETVAATVTFVASGFSKQIVRVVAVVRSTGVPQSVTN